MLKFKKRKVPLSVEGTINRLSMDVETEQLARTDIEDALIELGSLFADQEDAIVELADIIVGGE